MKTTITGLLTAALFFPTLALAVPAVGDSSTYLVTNQGESGTSTLNETQTITAIDPKTGIVTEQQSICIQGTVVSTQSMQTTLATLNGFDATVDHCAELAKNPPPGTRISMEEIQVKAGKFKSCHFSTTSQEIYFAHVPNGIAKLVMTSDDGTIITVELVAFTKN